MAAIMHGGRLSPLGALRSADAVVSVSVDQLKCDLLGASPQRAVASKPCDSRIGSPASTEAAITPAASVCSELDSSAAEPVTRSELLGCWVDSIGNFVLVRSADMPDEGLTAMLVKPWSENISLSLWCEEESCAWHCGGAALDLGRSSSRRLVWVFPEGRQMVWTWRAFTLEALEARGLVCMKDMACSEAEYHASPPSTPGSESSSQQWVPVCVHIAPSQVDL
eukprot:CAMPEP_0115242366 /NCGR_PEP_ID=MMETSP0270-20121206/38914_1 /TAXON_ID=71861 /ORGANISM="Scrippsiella trochoidea, Strain CCMP3099" /LENGTH=222 /DNA_ID=CAMNT_0002657427 /DNA_START=37 /DNA_END=705 /DNA_ORIENTATION=+